MISSSFKKHMLMQIFRKLDFFSNKKRNKILSKKRNFRHIFVVTVQCSLKTRWCQSISSHRNYSRKRSIAMFIEQILDPLLERGFFWRKSGPQSANFMQPLLPCFCPTNRILHQLRLSSYKQLESPFVGNHNFWLT